MLGVHSFSEVGGHRVNEDAFAVVQHPLDATRWLCFLADGQGGQPNGGKAAQLACEIAVAAAVKLPPEKLENPAVWQSLLRLVDGSVKDDPLAGLTTFVGLTSTPDRIVGVSGGDSAALLMADVGAVELTAKQKKNPPVGSGMAIGVPFEAKVNNPWRLIVMSDGVWKYAGWSRIIEGASRHGGSELLDELQRAARLPGSCQFQDDFTVVLIEAGSES